MCEQCGLGLHDDSGKIMSLLAPINGESNNKHFGAKPRLGFSALVGPASSADNYAPHPFSRRLNGEIRRWALTSELELNDLFRAGEGRFVGDGDPFPVK
jgi:hypothetical protein